MDFTGRQIASRRKIMLLSQRKAASLIEKKYGVKLSHSYLSLIESGSAKTIGRELKNALADFFGLTSSDHDKEKEYGQEKKVFTFQRIPLYEGRTSKSFLDLPGPELADFAVKAAEDFPEIGIFSGDIIVCRKEKAAEGDLIAIKGGRGFDFVFARGREPQEAIEKVILILKKSVNVKYYETLLAAAASNMEEGLLARQLAERAGIRKVDLLRSLEVLKLCKSKSGSTDSNDDKDQ
ncbi:MAG: hypothetical protein ACOY4I_14505 [Bacillota bacterium]